MMTTALACLAAAIYFEARGESTDGQIAVAEVVMNRVADERFPDDVCAVVKQNRRPGILHYCQFSFYCNGQREVVTDWAAWHKAKDIAQGVLENTLSLGVVATHYHTIDVEPWWASEYELLGTIGRHKFYLSGETE